MRYPNATLPAIVLAAMIPVAAQAQTGPVAQIQSYNAGINAIEKAGGGISARADRFEPLVARSYDMTAIAQLVVGPAWAQASATDKAAAVKALTHHSAVSLAKSFKGPTATAFTTDPTPISRAGSQIVKVTVGSDTLFYRMKGAKIIDVISEGVSQLALQRADLATTVSSGGVAALVKKLAQLDAVK